MCKKLCFLISFVLVLALFLASSVHAANIIWVSDNKGGDATDQGWIDLLVSQGFTVNLDFRNAQGRELDAAELAALNAADLIIISYDTASDKYNQAGEAAQWNGISKPVLLLATYISRASRWFWLDTTSVTNQSVQPTLQAVNTNHPILKGVTLNASNQVDILTSATYFVPVMVR